MSVQLRYFCFIEIEFSILCFFCVPAIWFALFDAWWQNVLNLFWTCVLLQIYKLENALDCSRGLQASLNAAVGAAVDRAVDRAVKAATAPLAANIRNLNIRLRNGRLNSAPTMPALPLTPPVKEVEGHPGRTPNDPALRDAAVESGLPLGLAFPAGGVWTVTTIVGLSDANIEDLEWFYNHPLGHTTEVRRQQLLDLFKIWRHRLHQTSLGALLGVERCGAHPRACISAIRAVDRLGEGGCEMKATGLCPSSAGRAASMPRRVGFSKP
jgi:hypothetical protein